MFAIKAIFIKYKQLTYLHLQKCCHPIVTQTHQAHGYDIVVKQSALCKVMHPYHPTNQLQITLTMVSLFNPTNLTNRLFLHHLYLQSYSLFSWSSSLLYCIVSSCSFVDYLIAWVVMVSWYPAVMFLHHSRLLLSAGCIRRVLCYIVDCFQVPLLCTSNQNIKLVLDFFTTLYPFTSFCSWLKFLHLSPSVAKTSFIWQSLPSSSLTASV